MKNKLIITSVLVVVLMASVVIGWGPGFHRSTGLTELCDNDDGTCTKTASNSIRQVLQENIPSFQAGIVFPDVAVFYYYTNFKVYQGTHDWSFADMCVEQAETDEELAFCYGIKVHLVEDLVSHNYYVPNMIRKYKVGNYLLHPTVELVAETNYYQPQLTSHMFENWQDYCCGPETIVYRTINLGLCKEGVNCDLKAMDFTTQAEWLNSIIGGDKFYTDGKAIPKTNKMKGFYSFLQKILGKFVKQDAYAQYESHIINNIQLVMDYDQHPFLDPSGREELANANKSADLWKYIITTLVFVGIFLLSKKLRWI